MIATWYIPCQPWLGFDLEAAETWENAQSREGEVIRYLLFYRPGI